jgi:HrpA-like RNA helicase
MREEKIPNIYSSEINDIVLNTIVNNSNTSIDNKNILNDLDLIDRIPNEAINSPLDKLFSLGVIDKDINITKLGQLIYKFDKLNIENSKLILMGLYYNVNLLDLITIACCLTIGKMKILTFKSKLTLIKNELFDVFDKSLYEDECIDIYNYNILKNRLFISCEFIDFILLFNKIDEIIVDNNIDLEEWCNDYGINYNGVNQVISLKEDIINTLIFNIGINPYLNSKKNINNLINISINSNKPKKELINELINEVSNIKKCLYESFKLNLASLDEKSGIYYSDHYNIQISYNSSSLIKSLPILKNGKEFEQMKPKKILFDSLIMVKNNETKNFIFSINNCISVLDGYIYIDNNFINS